MGLGFTLDSPLKVARFGITSVVSIIDDLLLEEVRKAHFQSRGLSFVPIAKTLVDGRSQRIKAYLNWLDDEVKKQTDILRNEPFGEGQNIDTYFRMLPDDHILSKQYAQMQIATGLEKLEKQIELRGAILPGRIDVNIMTKVDRPKRDKTGKPFPREYSDALAALRGYALSNLDSSVVFSAGLNPTLYSYIEQFDDFFPDEQGHIRKGVILKVSDYRSAMIQGKFLAKKGIWVSEFRIESGLNCGGHAFATEGMLMGPILDEFKRNRQLLNNTLLEMCNDALQTREKPLLNSNSSFRLTVQGGIGTAAEQQFLLENYELDGTGWGSPFLLVPEATSVDRDTLNSLLKAKKSDFYLSHASPLGIPFNNLRTSSSETQRQERITKNRPGSPCYKKYLEFNTEFTDSPICTASRQYQDLKLKQLREEHGQSETYTRLAARVLEKDCLCEGLGATVLLNMGVTPARKLTAVNICPGPNLAYFSQTYSLEEMTGHIYGKNKVIMDEDRPHMFIKELQLYVDYLKRTVDDQEPVLSAKFESYISRFTTNLQQGIEYYKNLFTHVFPNTVEMMETIQQQLMTAEAGLNQCSWACAGAE